MSWSVTDPLKPEQVLKHELEVETMEKYKLLPCSQAYSYLAFLYNAGPLALGVLAPTVCWHHLLKLIIKTISTGQSDMCNFSIKPHCSGNSEL